MIPEPPKLDPNVVDMTTHVPVGGFILLDLLELTPAAILSRKWTIRLGSCVLVRGEGVVLVWCGVVKVWCGVVKAWCGEAWCGVECWPTAWICAYWC